MYSLYQAHRPDRPVRLLGVTATGLEDQEEAQLCFLPEARELERVEHLETAVDALRGRYGGKALLKTEAGRYLNDSCWAYGFIIRYPYYGTEDTGIGYEPWHLRYVGSPHAQIMMENSWTLEEYFRRLEPGGFYQSGDVLITRQAGETFQLPEGWTQLSMSPDNQGCWVFTLTMETE